jgi:integrase
MSLVRDYRHCRSITCVYCITAYAVPQMSHVLERRYAVYPGQCRSVFSFFSGLELPVLGVASLAIWLQFFLGLRVGEVQALRWEDIDLESGALYVRRGYARHEKTFRDHPKGKRQLVRKIPSELFDVLKEARETAKTELVVVPNGYQMLEYSKYRKVLVHFCKEGWHHNHSNAWPTPFNLRALHGARGDDGRYGTEAFWGSGIQRQHNGMSTTGVPGFRTSPK